MDHQHEDIRRLLGKALAGEPPLRLDRGEVFRRGRRRLRHRRFAEAGAVVAAVVAIVAGAASLTGLLAGIDGALPPAATMTGTTTGTTSRVAPTGPSRPLTSPLSMPPTPFPPSDEHADRLTEVLASGLRLPAGVEAVDPVPGDDVGPLIFHRKPVGFEAAAVLQDRRGRGYLFIEVHPLTAPRYCEPVRAGMECAVEIHRDITMIINTQRTPEGLITYSVSAMRPDGTGVYVVTNNLADEHRSSGQPPTAVTRDEPPVDHAVLKSIAALPGLTVA